MPTPDHSLDTFRAWSAIHWAVIIAAAVISISLALLRRRLGQRGAGGRLDAALAAVTAVMWVVIQAAQMISGQFSRGTSLPLHVTDLILLAVPLALWFGGRWERAIIYYWGVALGTLAFVLPDLRDGPARLGFWFFWGGHVVILAAVVYDLVGRDYRPSWRDFWRATAVSVAYALLIVPFNAATGHSYGYLGPDQPAQPPVLRYFGPWPLRVGPIVLCGIAAMAVLTVPWELKRRRDS